MAAATLLTRVIDDKRSFDGLLDTRHGPQIWHKLEQADKNLARAIVTTALRHRGEIEFYLAKCLDRKLPKNARHLLHTLHVAAAQILFMNVPNSAAVDLAVTSLRNDQKSTRFANLGNAVLRRLSQEYSVESDAEGALPAITDETAKANMAPWLWKRVRKDYGREKALRIAAAHMHEPVLDITVKSDPEKWAETLGGTLLFGNSIRVPQEGLVSNWPGYEGGDWWVQDAAASLPACLMKDIAGKSVADLCAAPGGKSVQLALQGASVTAVEQSAERMKRLQQNFERLQLNADFVTADLFEWEPENKFDAILLDAPCSSTGTIRRHPDVQWTKSAEIVEELAALQKSMILHAADFLKPGGLLLFSNCSVDRAEGEDIVAALQKSNPELQLDPIGTDEVFGHDELVTRQGTIRTLPFHMDTIAEQTNNSRLFGLDGFFAARFVRTS